MSGGMNGHKVVRHANRNGGPCTLLGYLVDQTQRQFVYNCFVSDPNRRSYIPKRFVHLEPCLRCPDHPRSRYARHEEQTS